MRYKNQQTLTQNDRSRGKEYTYIMKQMPRHMDPTSRVIAGGITQPALCHNLLKSQVMVRGVQYTHNERAEGVKGLLKGRQRFQRQIKLLNQIQAYTNACPEVLDLIFTHNRDDFPEGHEDARKEPRLITEYFQGDSLDRFRSQGLKPKGALYNTKNAYWFIQDEELTDTNRFKRINVRRIVQLLLRLGTHCSALLDGGVVHLDIKPEHVLILSKDEVPRLVGIGHLAPLNKKGLLSPDDPVHAFTTAGFAAPELVSEGSWDQAQNGEAIMLYSLGALCLSIIYTGPQADLCKIWREGGRAAIDELITKMMNSSAHSTHRRLFQVVSDLLEPDPKVRLSKIHFRSLIEQMEALRYGSKSHADGHQSTIPKERQQQESKALVPMTCKQCRTEFMGHPKRSVFNYRGEAYQLCPEHHAKALTKVTYTATRCGHEVTEGQGLVWARSWMNWQPRARCNDCRS